MWFTRYKIYWSSGTLIPVEKNEVSPKLERLTFPPAIQLASTDSPGFPEPKKVRKAICKFEDRLRTIPGAVIGDSEMNPLTHSFTDGVYLRQMDGPADEIIVTKIHKIAHPFFLLKGEISILTEDGIVRIKAPYSDITKAGTKRIIYTHSPITIVTVHITEETDLEKIEEQIIAKDFDEMDRITEEQILQLKGEQSQPGGGNGRSGAESDKNPDCR